MDKKIIGVFIICIVFFMNVITISGFKDNFKTFEQFGSKYPDDFSMFIYCGGFNTWGNTYILYTNATGEAFYYNVTYDNITLGNFIPVFYFNFTNDEIQNIWDVIVTNDFFNLNKCYERETVCDGSFVNMTITGNGVVHSVQTENIDIDKLDNIVKLVNSLSPGDFDLFYNALFNHAPVTPSRPSGSSTGKLRDEYVYTTIGFDTDFDSIYFLFDWGDDTDSGWVGPYDSGENVSLSHSWIKKANYNVRVKAIDDPNNDGNLSDGEESDWSDSLVVSMPKSKQISTNNILFDLLKKILTRFFILKPELDLIETSLNNPKSSSENNLGFDPNSGTRGKLDEKKCEITITIDIKLWGKWVDQYSDKMPGLLAIIKNDIENKWNRDKWDKNNDKKPDGEKPWRVKCKDDCTEHEPGCTVKFVANVSYAKKVNGSSLVTGGSANSQAGQGHHWIEIADPRTPVKNSYVNSWNGKLPSPNDGSETTGVFNIMETIGVFAHEAGHLMGLGDQQDEKEVEENGKKVKKKFPKKGFQDNIMGWPSGWPSQADIDQIVKKSGIECPCKCCPEKNDTKPPVNKIITPTNGSKVSSPLSVNGYADDGPDGSGVAILDYTLLWAGGSYIGDEYIIDPLEEYVEYEIGPIHLEYYIDPGDWITINTYATDAEGNTGGNLVTVIWDEESEDYTPPVTLKTIGEPNEDGGYIIWPFTPITFTSSDSESGVNYIYYEVWWDSNGDGIIDIMMGSEKVYEESLMFSVDMWGVLQGFIELRWYAVDNVGNTENIHYQNHQVIS